MLGMPRLSTGPISKANPALLWLVCVVLGFSALNTPAQADPEKPQHVSLSADLARQQLLISWFGGTATTFDLIILRTEFNETVYYKARVSATVNQASGEYQFTWTSDVPLECTSLSVGVRSRDGQKTSEWSQNQIQGRDFPTNSRFQMYPQDRIVPVGANTTFCCIVEEGKVFKSINYSGREIKATRLSRRSYAATAVSQTASGTTGSNVICLSTDKKLAGAVVFVAYPPLPVNFSCETHDLVSAVCQWSKGRDTHLVGRKRETVFSIMGRSCAEKSPEQKCTLRQWDGNWTLVAVNPLGQHSLTDSADISHRVSPVAPANLTSIAHAWNATLYWGWTYSSYSSLALVCQVEITSHGNKTELFSGEGLQSVVLSDLQPDEHYRIRIRCGSQRNFWKWGNWSQVLSFTTRAYVPNPPDVWMWMNRDNTGMVVWKPLTRQQSRGRMKSYNVTFWNLEEKLHTQVVPADTYSVPFNLSQMVSFSDDNKVEAKVVANNVDRFSEPSKVPLRLIDVEPLVFSRVVYSDGGFRLNWEHNASTTCSYLVEWYDALCMRDCAVDWIPLAAGSTNVSIESENFQPGVRYNFSLYSCPSDAPELIQRWQGYMQELVPSSSCHLSVSQQKSDVILTWNEIPVADRRGYLQGYNVYMNNGFQLTLLANLSNLGTRNYTVKGLPVGSYKFTVKAYTSAGEDSGTTVSIKTEDTDDLILEILASLGMVTLLLVIATVICFKKRKWVKNAFYPDIPEPKLPSDWSRTPGPLDVKPSLHSMVHIVERPERDPSKDALVIIPEEDEDDEDQAVADEPVDTDEPQSLRYYNDAVDERPIRPRFPDSSFSSASSVDSANTDVTYTGIQTSCSSLVFQLDPQSSAEGHQHHSASCGGGGGVYWPQMHPTTLGDTSGLASSEPLLDPQAASSGGYKPQNSWHLDSPTQAGGNINSLGSPVSIASTQFLLPEEEEHEDEKRASATTWFSNLLSSSRP
uniref:Leukemia inhibitory factor receptor alpha a n=1 Tax=Nothobranchius rachovii TaxID=451742 RepID=A0A1A8SLZ3_9TELE